MEKVYIGSTHFSVDIRGFLENTRRKDISGIITDDNGKELNDYEARNFLYDCLSKGWKVIPSCDSEKCPDFDYFGNGCPGHRT